jgi:putative ABC transport system permease protein
MKLSSDFRHAFRVARRSPTTTVIVVLTLALCIGANTAIFSIVDATLFRPLPYLEPERLVGILRHYDYQGGSSDNTGQTGRMWERIRDHATLLDPVAYSYGTSGVNFAAGGNVQYVKQQRVGAGFFRILGVEPFIGREFTPAEDRPGGPPVAVLSYSMWRRLFGRDSSIVGKTLMLRGEPYTVIGVMPEIFQSNVPVDVWTPLRASITGEGQGSNYNIIGRLKPGISFSAANAQIEAIGAPLFQEMKVPPEAHARLRIAELQQSRSRDVRKPLLIVWAAVGLVLLIGCANVAGLLLARAATRMREVATRLALGGSRGAIASQLLMETLVLALFGGALGIPIGYMGLEGLKVIGSQHYGIVRSAHLDVRVLSATALLSILVTLFAGVFPALEAGVVDIRTALTETGTRGVAGIRRRWSRRVLVAGEVAIAVMLLIGAGLLLRTLARFYELQPGFDPAHVYTASFSLQDARYASATQVQQFFNSGLERVRALPGVQAAAGGLTLPFERALNTMFKLPSHPDDTSQTLIANFIYVTPGYTETLRIPVLRGRSIRNEDTANSASVAVVNEAFVSRFLSKGNPLGDHISFGEKQPREIVGVISNVQQAAGFGDFGPFGDVPAVYVPVTQTDIGFLQVVHAWFAPNWIARIQGAPSPVLRRIQEIATAIDPLVPIAEFRSIDEVRSWSLSWHRFQATLLGSLSGLALLLALVGIYGLMSHSVVERTRELGIRMALGSTLGQAIRDAIRPGILLAVAGIVLGCVLAGFSGKVLQHAVWGVKPSDPATYTMVAVGLLLAAASASLIPALRIARVNPADTLRDE